MTTSFKTYLAERKNLGTLYHFTNLHGAMGILKDMEIASDTMYAAGVAFTRMPMLKHTTGRSADLFKDMPWGPVRFAIDGELLSDNNKLQPYSWHGTEGGRFPAETRSIDNDQAEEISKKTVKTRATYFKQLDISIIAIVQHFLEEQYLKPVLGDKFERWMWDTVSQAAKIKTIPALKKFMRTKKDVLGDRAITSFENDLQKLQTAIGLARKHKIKTVFVYNFKKPVR